MYMYNVQECVFVENTNYFAIQSFEYDTNKRNLTELVFEKTKGYAECYNLIHLFIIIHTPKLYDIIKVPNNVQYLRSKLSNFPVFHVASDNCLKLKLHLWSQRVVMRKNENYSDAYYVTFRRKCSTQFFIK